MIWVLGLLAVESVFYAISGWCGLDRTLGMLIAGTIYTIAFVAITSPPRKRT